MEEPGRRGQQAEPAREWADQGIELPFTWSDPGGSIPAGLASRFAAGGIEDTIAAMAGRAQGPDLRGALSYLGPMHRPQHSAPPRSNSPIE